MAEVTKPIALDESLNTTESTPRNIADVLASGLASIANNVKPDASDIPLSVSGMSANNVQDGVSELKGTLTPLNSDFSAENISNTTVASGNMQIMTELKSVSVSGKCLVTVIVTFATEAAGEYKVDYVRNNTGIASVLVDLKKASGGYFTYATSFIDNFSTDTAITIRAAHNNGSNTTVNGNVRKIRLA